MDPYLEGSLWTTFHHSLAAEIVRELAPRLRPRYLVFPEERFDAAATVPLRLATVMPEPVPLLAGDPDADLDLQRVFTQVYDLLGYDLAFDYGRPPEVPLSVSQAAWAAEHLTSA
jgi:Protein of unknown function (DUF4058)